MSKRTATELQEASSSENKKPFRQESKVVNDDGIGEFEDGWEDEYESDEEVAEGKDDGVYLRFCNCVLQVESMRSVEMEVDEDVLPPIEESEEKPPAPNVFIPGVHQLGKDEVLEARCWVH